MQALPSLAAENLDSFVRNGTVYSVSGRDNHNYQLKYEARLIFTDYAGNLAQILIPLTAWLHEHEPTLPPEGIRFDADSLNHESADIEIRFELTELVKVIPDPDQGGYHLITCPAPQIDDV